MYNSTTEKTESQLNIDNNNDDNNNNNHNNTNKSKKDNKQDAFNA